MRKFTLSNKDDILISSGLVTVNYTVPDQRRTGCSRRRWWEGWTSSCWSRPAKQVLRLDEDDKKLEYNEPTYVIQFAFFYTIYRITWINPEIVNCHTNISVSVTFLFHIRDQGSYSRKKEGHFWNQRPRPNASSKWPKDHFLHKHIWYVIISGCRPVDYSKITLSVPPNMLWLSVTLLLAFNPTSLYCVTTLKLK